jgi:F-type H+-transporting ATPase subunit delta
MAHGNQDKIAKRYARALFSVTEPLQFDTSIHLLNLCAQLWQDNPDFRTLLTNPQVSEQDRVGLVQAILPKETPAALQRTLVTLVELRKAEAMPAVAKIFAELVREYRRNLSLDIACAQAPSEQMAQQLADVLSRSLGSEVSVAVKHDPSLLGGMTIRLGDRYLDRSVAGAMRRIVEQVAR